LDALVKKLGLDTGRGRNKLFVCGDARTGPGLVVRAIAGGISAAEDIDRYLKTR
jgi:NADPH-dependent glutamate synthase beta subunit-like oxidoreductase